MTAPDMAAGWLNFCTTCLRETGRTYWIWLAWLPSRARASRFEMDKETPHVHASAAAVDDYAADLKGNV